MDQKSFIHRGEKLYIHTSKYNDGGGQAIVIVDGNRSPYATLTVNVPEVPLEEGELVIKTWSGNQSISDTLRKSGLFEDTGKRVPVGYVQGEIWRWV